MCEQLDLSHFEKSLQDRIFAFIVKYWSVFDKRGIFAPVHNYKCIIDTGNTAPIAIKKILYGPKEIPIMQKVITTLQKVGHIQQIHDRRWLFKTVLAPKPFQEHVKHNNNVV
jgi:hypothetical protein